MNQPLAYVHPGAKIATNVVVEPFTTIHNNVEIGSGTWIGSNVTIMEGARIGKNCRIFPGAVISAIPQDLKFEDEESLAIIGDNTTIRECVTINRGTNASGKTVVGENCLIMATAHIAHDCVIGDNAIIVNGVALAGHVVVGKHAIIGGLAAVHQFIHIGEHAMISGGSLVRKDVPPFTKAAKDPLSFVGINSIGLRRRGFSTEKIREIQNIYRILYQSKYNNTQALEKVEAEMPASSERDQIITFIRNSQRGIMKGYIGNN
ncbi:acyl-ACP--UDP-N-acetylglucosamine O-acyltransferase [Aureivirga sp. CE67]|uniref:acyl-ACP--UDP-N-acetylglucosamine O-acyltransferase n=1 Tax=Aureivirga sp. CE67 TaxID=1788983 RepID=UPI0018CAD2F0|nr:acyl-ACP--UDP-N-acetylglucosamine O-acyltransferase [Aureivirga sp. CE67]